MSPELSTVMMRLAAERGLAPGGLDTLSPEAHEQLRRAAAELLALPPDERYRERVPRGRGFGVAILAARDTVLRRPVELLVPLAGGEARLLGAARVGSSRVDLQACKLEYSIVSPK